MAARASSHPPPAKMTKVEKRHFLPSWISEFPWVRCQYCVDAGKTNAFPIGCEKYKEDALSKHALTTDHRGIN